MSYHIQSSFAAGELDPALHERTTFDKYQAGLKTLRNTIVGKSGRLISRAGTSFNIATKSPVLIAGTFTADASTNLATWTSHPLRRGDRVRVSSTATLPGGLVAGTDYYVVLANGTDTFTTFGFATTLALALAATKIDLTTAGTGVLTVTPQDVDKKCVIFSPPYSPYIIEWGHGYVRIHDGSGAYAAEAAHEMNETDLPYVQFVPNGLYVYIFCYGRFTKKMVLGNLDGSVPLLATRFLSESQIISIPAPPAETSRVIGGTGYAVQYAVTQVSGGQESYEADLVIGAGKLPINATEKNTLVLDCTNETGATEVRVYRRPENGIAFGFMASVRVVAGAATVIDYGGDVDYTHQPPTEADFHIAFVGPNGRTGCVYQQRLVTTAAYNDELIAASRTGYQNNFYRDFPYSDDSSLVFKAGASGNAKVLRLLDNDGLLAFTTVGIFRSTGALTPTNLAMDKKGNWIIEEKVPPLEVPGGILFVDKSTNSVRSLIFSNEAGGYPGEEVSIFSNHFFVNKKVISWAFQDGDTSLVWVVMSDGSLISLTYQREHQMQAWSRHDSDGAIFESVTVLKDLSNKSVAYFVVNRNGTRLIENSTARYVSDIKDFIGMDSAVTFKTDMTGGTALVDVTANTPGDWEGLLTLTSDTSIFANTAGNGAVGSVFRFFDSEGTAVDFTVTTYTSNKIVIVRPSIQFPEDEADDITFYKTFTTITGLTHLEGKVVSMLVDGYVVGSPNNDEEEYLEDLIVTGGAVTLPNSGRGAIIQVGVPFTADVETLDIDTVEQKPTFLESRLIHKVYLKVLNTRGIFIGSQFPDLDKVAGMRDPEEMNEEIDLGNAAQVPYTKRHEIAIPNDWNVNGKICIRQVDPLPFEILSIIPDLAVLY